MLLTVLTSFGLAPIEAAETTRFELRTEVVTYRQGETELEGVMVYNGAQTGRRPAVLVVHQWLGLSDYERKRAEMLAELGYAAFCADIYGKGIRPANPGEAGALAGRYKNDRVLLRARVQAALDTMKQQGVVDPAKTAAIGYCFGGTTVLELARAGADTRGVVSFHGGLASPTTGRPGGIKAAILALHGADDPFVPPAEVTGFEDEMRQAKADWQLVAYGGAVHSFTDWKATGAMPGAKYDEKADRRSWAAMKQFLDELFH